MKKILCFRNSRLGDYLISIPALNIIRNENKNCKIYYLTDKNKLYKNLPQSIENNKIVDKFIDYDLNFKSLFKLLLKLKSKNFDKIYYLQEKSNLYRELRDYIFFSLINLKNKNGFFTKRKNYKKYSETIQISNRVNSKLKSRQIYNFSKLRLKTNKPIHDFKYITISIGGFSQPSLWKINKWSFLTKLILSNSNYKILIIGTKDDIVSANQISLINKNKIINLCNKTSLNQLINIIKFSKFHITNDNGSMHVSTLFKKKTICLFNNHDPEGKWYPLNKNAIILRDQMGVNKISPIKVFKNLCRFSDFRYHLSRR